MATYRFLTSSARRAFSLVELVLAIGITVFVLLILVGFLALGVQTAADSRDDSIAALLAENLRTELITDSSFAMDPPQLAFDSDNNDVGIPVFFNFDGRIVEDEAEARYLALIALEPSFSDLPEEMRENAGFRYWQSGDEVNSVQRLHVRIFAGTQTNRQISAFSLVRAISPS
ncbi:MAG: hypothetical protein LAT55_08945 [Opitutales bacterium]|nr:hypothetical protein [Opitutales bacterium]